MGYLNGNGKVFREEEVRLVDLAAEDAVIDGLHFEDCHVLGPVVMIVEGELDLVNNTIEGDPDAFLWEIDPQRERVTGAVLVKNTTFEGCTFTNVGLAGYHDFIEQIRATFESRHALS